MSPLVSIIVPCYNCVRFIQETLDSLLSQSFKDFEVILVDDGSTDDLMSALKRIKDERLTYIYQDNKGVSSARNKGSELAKGKYLIFFDADDLMTEDFISTRTRYLQDHPEIDFVSGPVIKLSKSGERSGPYAGTSNDGVREILTFDQKVITCPSNFMFKREFLLKSEIVFDTELSSTADRFFLIQCHLAGNGVFDAESSALIYRVSENSMSNLLTEKLVKDNARFYELLLRKALIPENLRKEALFKGYYSIAASYYKLHRYLLAVRYSLLAILKDPVHFMRKTLKFST